MKVLIADDHDLMLAGVKRALAAAGMSVVGEARRGADVLPLIAATGPDVVLLDMRMPDVHGLTTLERIRERYPRTKVVMLSASDDVRQIRGALRAGAAGYVLKSIDPRDLASAVRQAVDGCVFTAVTDGEADGRSAARAAGLSEREHGVLAGLAPPSSG